MEVPVQSGGVLKIQKSPGQIESRQMCIDNVGAGTQISLHACTTLGFHEFNTTKAEWRLGLVDHS